MNHGLKSSKGLYGGLHRGIYREVLQGSVRGILGVRQWLILGIYKV